MTAGGPAGQRVVVVTGGGGGIGAAIAVELGRRGDHVVTVDPLVSVDGSEQLPPPAEATETTAGRIVAAGGSAQAAAISVTDRPALHGLFQELLAERGRLDAVINVAGITRPTSYARGDEDDWRAVLAVHLDGYRTVLEGALAIMAEAGRGHILGVTSGSGWRAADAGAYACAKRAVAALTWELGRAAPPGVTVNAISPIAVTRMVTAALARAGAASAAKGGSSATGGLSLGSMPDPTELGPLAAHLVGPDQHWCQGQVLFAGGSEVAVVERPRLLEVASTTGAASLPHLLETVVAEAFAPAERAQRSGGGGNPRFGAAFELPAEPDAMAEASGAVPGRTCGIVTDQPELGAALVAAIEARGATAVVADPATHGSGFDGARTALASLTDQLGTLDAVVVAMGGGAPSTRAGGSGWREVLASHEPLPSQLHADAAWARAAADRAAATDAPLRLVVLTDAATPGGRSRAQASAQLARAGRRATRGLLAPFAVAVEGAAAGEVAAELAALLATGGPGEGGDLLDLCGAELAVAPGWVGLRRHPQPTAAAILGGPELPAWFDDVLRDAIDAPRSPR